MEEECDYLTIFIQWLNKYLRITGIRISEPNCKSGCCFTDNCEPTFSERSDVSGLYNENLPQNITFCITAFHTYFPVISGGSVGEYSISSFWVSKVTEKFNCR